MDLSLILISPSKETLGQAAESILNGHALPSSIREGTDFTLVPDAESLENSEELFRFLTYAKAEEEEEAGVLRCTDDAAKARYKELFRMEEEIRNALLTDRVEVFLQPIYSAKEAAFTSAEALVRIRKEDGSLLSPGLFIPVAEQNGQILELGERVFEKVCQFLKESTALSLGLHYIEVNLSVVQCEKEDLADRLIAMTQKYTVDPCRINLEITETGSIRSRKILLANMKKLISYGFSFSLDDFGKGESNLMYVVEMPVSIIKLDYDMSKAFFSSEKAHQVVRAVLSMAHGMGLAVVAEGIETAEEKEKMLEEGVDYIQGFYYSRPLPCGEFLELLRR